MTRSLAFALLCFALLTGCGPSQGDIEKSIKNEMKTSMNVEITSVNLTKGGDGGYTGTAAAGNGDTYDVVVQPAKGGRSEWTATPAQATIEKMARDMINGQNVSKVKTLSLTKQGQGVFTGTAVLENGAKLNISSKLEGRQIMLRADPQ